MTKKSLKIFIFFILSCLFSFAQVSLYRTYTQTYPNPNYFYYGGFSETPIKTADGGYLISTRLMYLGFESPGGIGYSYTIKTDSNFVPQWKKQYPFSMALPTGGILLFGQNTIEKVTASGAQVWKKSLSGSIALNDAVSYGTNVRFIGNTSTYSYVPGTGSAVYIYDGITLLMDSSGNYISHQLFYSSTLNAFPPTTYTYRGTALFSKIRRDAFGNFYLYSNNNSYTAYESSMSLAKFGSSFNFLWGKTWNSNSNRVLITDIDFLQNGRIFACGISSGNTNYSSTYFPALFKLDAQGNLIQQCYFNTKTRISTLCKKTSGNYVVSVMNQDSLFMFETDTSMNIIWHKYRGKALSTTGSVIEANQLYTSLYSGIGPVIISNDLQGNSCASYSIPFSKPSSSISLVNFTLSPVAYSLSVNTETTNVIYGQSYVDSCKCPVFVPALQNHLCVGSSATVSIQGSGNLSWYGSSIGNTFIHAGSQHIFSSSTPTVITLFAQDSACTANPNRTMISVTIHAVPVLTISPLNPTICLGGQVFVGAYGAINYTWSNNSQNSNLQNLNPLVTTNYTVTGSVATGCSDTKTLTVNVIPTPTITVTGPTSLCVGSTATYTASGANNYTWPGNVQSSVYTYSAIGAGLNWFNCQGSIGNCMAYKQVTLSVISVPILSITNSPTLICQGQTTTLTANGANTYVWSTGSLSSSITPNLQSSTVYSVLGNSNGCSSTATINLVVYNLPTPTAISSQTQVCEGTPVSFSGFGANSYTWNNVFTGPAYTIIPAAGIQNIILSGHDGTCTATITKTIKSFANPSVSITSSTGTFCIGVPATISAQGANSYTWSNNSNNSQIVIVPITNTVIYVQGSNNICYGSDSINIIVHNNPIINVSSNLRKACFGDTIKFNASGALYYSWSNGVATNTMQTTASFNQNYTVTGINAQGCSNKAVTSINVFPFPVISLVSTNSLICSGESATINAYGAMSYTWNNNQTGNFINVLPYASTTYTVIGENIFGCSSTAYFTQNVDECTWIKLSNNIATELVKVFPNPTKGDLTIQLPIIFESLKIEVYNCLGQLLDGEELHEQTSRLELSHLVKGVYIIKLIKSNESIFVTKIVKQE